MARYALANHVFVCLQDEHVVFLDVHQDRYFALEAAKTRGLAECVRGWPTLSREDTTHEAGNAEAEVVALLARRGLLTEDTRAAQDAMPPRLESPTDEIVADDFAGEPSHTARSLVVFIIACLSARITLQVMSFERLIARARRRRARALARNDSQGFDRERAQRAIATFAALRPFFFTAKDACLFEALALTRFLAPFGFYPQWVFGVQARPFAAHCWLQHEGIVLNDTVEHVSRYSPIMVV
jgi:hypothetical protein